MAILKNTSVSDNLELPQGTTAQRSASPQGGQIRYNTDLEMTELYNGTNWRPLSDTRPEATGGTVVDTDIGGVPYRIHYFTETGTNTLAVTNPGEVEYLIVAGGGGGGAGWNGGGGGAGGVVTGSTIVSASNYNIVVGSGGINGRGTNASNGRVPTNGGNSSAFGITATGGGSGGQEDPDKAAQDGGSGGGGVHGQFTSSGSVAPGNGIAGQGNSGGAGVSSSPDFVGGGGGGAGSTGVNALSSKAGNGGQGILSGITGNIQFYGGGGGGSHRQNPTNGKGGLGGGGAGGTPTPGRNGVPNTGSGGGAGAAATDNDGIGGNGGSGIVIVRYPRNSSLVTEPDRTVVARQPNNYNIISDSSLFMLLDPSNPVCFSGGTTCRNLQTGGLVTGANGTPSSGTHSSDPSNFPSYNSIHGGIFDFDGGKGMNFEEDLGTRTELTFTMWFYRKGSGYFSDARNDGGEWFLSNYQSRNITYTHSLAYNFNGVTTGDYLANGPNFDNRWYHMTVVSDANESKLYLNGSEVDQYVNNAPINTTFGKNFRIGCRYTTSNFWTGYMGSVYAYSRILSPTEIKSNFDAERHRYGL